MLISLSFVNFCEGQEIKELAGRMQKQDSGHKQIRKIDPASGGTTYIDNSHGLFRI